MADDNGAAGAGAGSDSGAGAGAGAGSGSAAGTAAGSGAGTGAAGSSQAPGQAGSQTGYTFKEDRSDWFPKHRYDEVNSKFTAAETARKTLEAQLNEANGRIRALAGVETPDPGQAKLDQVRNQFLTLFPQFKRLTDLTPEQLDRVLDAPNAVQGAQAAEARGWAKHGDTSVAHITDRVAEAYGVENLSNEQSAEVRTSFTNWLGAKVNAELEASGGQRSDTLARYERGEEALLDEFSNDFVKRWVEPARRTALAGTTSRIRPVVNSSGRGQVTSRVERPAENASMDQRLDYAIARLKEQGMQFGGRG